MTVAIVKAMIQDLEMVPMDEQVLSFDGRELEDNDSLADYYIQRPLERLRTKMKQAQ